jgi:hypothetical protein
MSKNTFLLPATCLTLLLGGCSDRTTQRHDHIVLDREALRDLVLVTDPTFGPDHLVVHAARVPEAYYADGAIHLTNGRELRIVQPHAWNAYSGTALTMQEAQQVLDRARAIESAQADQRATIRRLRELLEAAQVAPATPPVAAPVRDPSATSAETVQP